MTTASTVGVAVRVLKGYSAATILSSSLCRVTAAYCQRTLKAIQVYSSHSGTAYFDTFGAGHIYICIKMIFRFPSYRKHIRGENVHLD